MLVGFLICILLMKDWLMIVFDKQNFLAAKAINSVVGLFICSLMLVCAPTYANDIQAGKAKAKAACVICHGALGLSQMPSAPHLAGQPAIYFEEQMKNYRSGKRVHEIMGVIAKPLTDADIANLAAWYSSLKIEVKVEEK
jgi:cytochrome c553